MTRRSLPRDANLTFRSHAEFLEKFADVLDRPFAPKVKTSMAEYKRRQRLRNKEKAKAISASGKFPEEIT